MVADNAMHDRQPKPGARGFRSVEGIKNRRVVWKTGTGVSNLDLYETFGVRRKRCNVEAALVAHGLKGIS